MTKTSQKLQDLAEFNWIQELSGLSGSKYGVDSSKPGDDAALLELNEAAVLIAKDMLIEGTHFKTEWSKAKEWIRKAFVANVSDIEAMGGSAHSVLCGISFSKKWSENYKREIAVAIAACLKEFDLKLVGGDTTSSEIGVISLTLVGKKSDGLLTRNSFKPKDELWVQGELGASCLGLELLIGSTENDFSKSEKILIQEHVNPKVEFGLGKFLCRHKLSVSAMDMSDGLGQSLFHIAEASNVKMVIEEALIPISNIARDVKESLKEGELLEAALWGGEEYKLVFSVPKGKVLPPQAITKWKLSRVGHVEFGEGCYMKRSNNEKIALNLKGFSHF